MDRTLRHLRRHVIPKADEYVAAERALSERYNEAGDKGSWQSEADRTFRVAAELSVAIDALRDRYHCENKVSRNGLFSLLGQYCTWPGSGYHRDGTIERVCAVANVYKHLFLSDQRLPISSEDDVLVVGTGYGTDAFGVGKFSGPEVWVRLKDGSCRKFLGDAPVAIRAWLQLLQAQTGAPPVASFKFGDVQFFP